MTNPVKDTPSVPSRPERLEALRKNLGACIDEIVNARADRMAALRKEFDAAWKELNAEIEPTLH